MNAWFQVGVQHLSAGSYIFSAFSEDTTGIKSSLLTFPVSVTKNTLTKIEHIFIAPTIATNKREVKKGDPIIIFGQSTPVSDVTLEVNSENQIFVKTPSDQTGAYTYAFDSSVLETGLHHTHSRTVQGATISAQSATVAFTVGTKNIYAEPVHGCPSKADFNNDCRVNLIDFSIAAFWSDRTLSPAFRLREMEEVSGDGKVTLVDFSIMAFYWTG
jgi:hypothetical protein